MDEDDADEREAEGDLVGNELGGAAHPPEQGEAVVRRPAADEDPVDPERQHGQDEGKAGFEVGDLERDDPASEPDGGPERDGGDRHGDAEERKERGQGVEEAPDEGGIEVLLEHHLDGVGERLEKPEERGGRGSDALLAPIRSWMTALSLRSTQVRKRVSERSQTTRQDDLGQDDERSLMPRSPCRPRERAPGRPGCFPPGGRPPAGSQAGRKAWTRPSMFVTDPELSAMRAVGRMTSTARSRAPAPGREQEFGLDDGQRVPDAASRESDRGVPSRR